MVAGPALCAVLGLAVGLFLNALVESYRCHACPDADADADGDASVSPAGPLALGAVLVSLRRAGLRLRGRACPWCGRPETGRFVLVELLTAGLFAAAAARFGADPVLPAYLVFFASLVVLSVVDLELQILPNRIVYPTIFLSVPLLAAGAAIDGELDRLGTALLGAALAFGALFLVHILYPAGMGFGDVRLSFILGLFLGWFGLNYVFVGMFLGFVLGAVVGVLLMIVRLRRRTDSLPFGPFLAAGATIAVLVGDPVVGWWLQG